MGTEQPLRKGEIGDRRPPTASKRQDGNLSRSVKDFLRNGEKR